MRTLLILGALLTACGAAPKPPVTIPAPEAAPACPDAIEPGGDAAEAEAFVDKPVARVCLIGSAASRKTAARVALVPPGDSLTAARIRQDLGALMKLGLFRDASAFGIAAPRGTVVVYVLRDRPRVADIAFEGVKVLRDSANARLTVTPGQSYDPLVVSQTARALRDEYAALGYGACRIVLVTEPMAEGSDQLRVRLKVDEGPRWRLGAVTFRGNQRVSTADLRSAATLKPGEPFVEDEVEIASNRLSALMFDRGFIAMRVDRETAPADAAGNVAVTFVMSEGSPHTLRALHVTKTGAPFEKEILEKVVKARPNQLFVRSALVADIMRIKAFFAARSQPVAIYPQTAIDPIKHTVDVTLAVEPE